MSNPDITLGGWLARRAAASPDARALTFEGSTLTFSGFFHRVKGLAAGLKAGGLCPGDRVGFLGLNHPAFLETMFSAARLGAIFVPLNFRLTGPELAFIIADAGIHTLVVDAEHTDVIDEIRPMLPVRLYVGTGDWHGQWQDYEELLSRVPNSDEAVAVDPDSTAVIMYTSGTTGRPKGAMLTHANLWWSNVSQAQTNDILTSDVTLVAAPLFHIGGLNVTTLVTWLKGGEVLLFRSFDAGSCLEAISRYGVTTMFGVPSMFLFMSQHPGFGAADLTSVRTLVCGGAPVPEPLIRLYADRGIPIQQGYGLTETAPAVSLLGSVDALDKIGSAGRPMFFVDIRIADVGGSAIDAPGEVGEVCVRGPNVMKGYWNRPDATAAAIDAEGWFHTGDAGYIDKDGFLYISDRFKDMVISGGENIYPAEIESVLYDHPAVAEVAIIGMPDEQWGEAVVAVVAPKPYVTVTLEDLRDFGGRSLARYKLPTRLHTVDALPRNPAGKVLKYELRARFAEVGEPGSIGAEPPVTPADPSGPSVADVSAADLFAADVSAADVSAADVSVADPFDPSARSSDLPAPADRSDSAPDDRSDLGEADERPSALAPSDDPPSESESGSPGDRSAAADPPGEGSGAEVAITEGPPERGDHQADIQAVEATASEAPPVEARTSDVSADQPESRPLTRSSRRRRRRSKA